VIEMDFPANVAEPCPPPPALQAALGCKLRFVGTNRMDYLVEVADESTLRALKPDIATLTALPVRGVIVTSQSSSAAFDFVSRFFAPAAGVNEDPVTGSAHCALGPYWQARLGKSDFTAYQASARGGVVRVGLRGERVLLGGQAVTTSRVEFLH
jgi:PhzF family phenazine biosynthesis protein